MTARLGFLEHFNLKSLDELPPLAELRDIEKISEELNMRLPVDEPADADESADGSLPAEIATATDADAGEQADAAEARQS